MIEEGFNFKRICNKKPAKLVREMEGSLKEGLLQELELG